MSEVSKITMAVHGYEGTTSKSVRTRLSLVWTTREDLRTEYFRYSFYFTNNKSGD